MLRLLKQVARAQGYRARLRQAPNIERAGVNVTGDTGEETTGLDYSIANNVSTTKEFSTYEERFDHLDTYFGAEQDAAFDSTAGHAHGGTDGDGPNIPSSSVTGVEAHLLDEDLHHGEPPWRTDAFGVYDDFNRGIGKWTVVTGAPSATHFDVFPALAMVAGDVIRLNAPATRWTDRFAVEIVFDLSVLAATRTLTVRLRRAETASAHVAFKLSTSDSCGIYDVTAEGVETARHTGSVTMPNTDTFKRCRIVLDGASASQWIHLAEFEPGGDFPVEASLPTPARQSGTVTVPAGNGVIEIETSCECYISSVHIYRCAVADVSDITDEYGRFTGLLVAPEDRHGYTHNAIGVDPLDVDDMADRDSRLLTVAEKTVLLPGGVLHGHTALAVQTFSDPLDPPLGGSANAHIHVRDQSLHKGEFSAVTLRRTPALFVPDGDYSTEANGTQTLPARSDHGHIMPYWYATAGLTPGTSPAGHYCTKSCFLLPLTSQSNAFVSSPDGSITYTAFSRSEMPFPSAWSEHRRYRAKFYNDGADGYANFLVTSSVPISVSYSVGSLETETWRGTGVFRQAIAVPIQGSMITSITWYVSVPYGSRPVVSIEPYLTDNDRLWGADGAWFVPFKLGVDPEAWWASIGTWTTPR